MGVASPDVQDNPSPLDFRVYAENRKLSCPDCGTPALSACAKTRPAALRTNYVSVPIWPHWIAPLIPMVSHALPPMQWALAGAKRLECGSLLPICFCAQTTCLEPDRHNAANNVSVPISASEGFLHRLRQPRTGTMGNRNLKNFANMKDFAA